MAKDGQFENAEGVPLNTVTKQRRDQKRIGQMPEVAYTRKALELDTRELTGRLTRWLLEGERLETLLAETKLRDVMIAVGIMTDKMLLLEGQPNANLGVPQQAKLDQVTAALAAVMQQRGLGTVTLTERTVEMKEKVPSG
jgi:hypothetical protein